MRENVGWCAGKQQQESLMIRTTALEENGTRCRRDVRYAALRSHYLARLLFAVQLSSLEIALVMDICHALSRAAAYEKAPRRNN